MSLKFGNRHASLFAVAGAVTVTAAVLAGCGGSSSSSTTASAGGGSSSKLTPVTVAVSLSSSSLQSYVAAQEGFFKKNGLNVTLAKIDNKTNLVDGLGHSFDFGITYGPTVIAADAKGLGVVAVAGANEAGGSATPDTALLLAPNSKITSISQLAGQRIGAGTTNGVTNLMTLVWLKQVNVQPTSVTAVAVSLGTMGDQLQAGRIAAAEGVQPYIAQLQKQGYKSLGFVENHVLPNPTAVSVWAANKTWADQHKSVVAKFQAAEAEATTWIYSHRSQSNQLLSQQIGVPVASIESAPNPDYRAKLTTTDLSTFVSMMQSVGWLKTSVSPSSMVYGS
jgi:NitT/TauT family transport system substrate-binding protein